VLLIGPVTAVIEQITQPGDIGALVFVVTVERMTGAVSHHYNEHNDHTGQQLLTQHNPGTVGMF